MKRYKDRFIGQATWGSAYRRFVEGKIRGADQIMGFDADKERIRSIQKKHGFKSIPIC